MRPRHVVTVVGLIVLAAVLVICGLMYTTDQNQADDLLKQYSSAKHNFDRTNVYTILETIGDNNDNDASENPVPYTTSDITSFLDACVKAHHIFYHGGLQYDAANTYPLNQWQICPDCAGYVGFALYLYGTQIEPSPVTTNRLRALSDLHEVQYSSVSDLLPGDILVYNSHVEVLEEVVGSEIHVCQWGSHQTAEGLYTEGVTDHEVDACTANVTTTSGTFASGQTPVVFRFSGASASNPPPAPNPQPNPSPPIPGIPPQPTPNPTPTGQKVLNIPKHVSQSAAPWGSTSLGGSKNTVSKSGCFASSIIMMAMYYNGKAYTDDQIMAIFGNSKYFSGPDLKSSAMLSDLCGRTLSGKTVVTDKSTIVKSIDAGNPVILHFTALISGVYEHGSGTHFVVVKGYDDAGVIIEDPNDHITHVDWSVALSGKNIEYRLVN